MAAQEAEVAAVTWCSPVPRPGGGSARRDPPVPCQSRCQSRSRCRAVAQDAAALLALAVLGPAAAPHQHPELRGAPGGGGQPAAALAPPPAPREPRAARAHRADVRGGLQPGAADAFLVPVAGRGVPRPRRALPQDGAEEGAAGPAGGLAQPGGLVLRGHRHPGGPDSAGELGRAEGEILGTVQGRLERVAGGADPQFPLRAARLPRVLRQRGDPGLGHLPVLPQTPATQRQRLERDWASEDPARRLLDILDFWASRLSGHPGFLGILEHPSQSQHLPLINSSANYR